MEYFPDEIYQTIFKYLSNKELLLCALVSFRWRSNARTALELRSETPYQESLVLRYCDESIRDYAKHIDDMFLSSNVVVLYHPSFYVRSKVASQYILHCLDRSVSTKYFMFYENFTTRHNIIRLAWSFGMNDVSFTSAIKEEEVSNSIFNYMSSNISCDDVLIFHINSEAVKLLDLTLGLGRRTLIVVENDQQRLFPIEEKIPMNDVTDTTIHKIPQDVLDFLYITKTRVMPHHVQ
jgi:hypothetical protein